MALGTIFSSVSKENSVSAGVTVTPGLCSQTLVLLLSSL